jgi:hypothetical protein
MVNFFLSFSINDFITNDIFFWVNDLYNLFSLYADYKDTKREKRWRCKSINTQRF